MLGMCRRVNFSSLNRYQVPHLALSRTSRILLVHLSLTLIGSRKLHLNSIGFVEFHLLKGSRNRRSQTLASHAAWKNRATFEAWTKSEAFRTTHNWAENNKSLYLDHPRLEGFELRQTVRRGKGEVA
jgi:heme-degrading monooxygenase HmoA